MSNDTPEMLPEGVVYFTTRKTKAGWIAEKVYSENGFWKREIIDVAGGRMHALEQFKIAVSRYWTSQKRDI